MADEYEELRPRYRAMARRILTGYDPLKNVDEVDLERLTDDLIWFEQRVKGCK